MKESTKLFLVDNYKFFIIFVLLGFIAYWTWLVVEPTLQILTNEMRQDKQAREYIKLILTNARNNTDEIKMNSEAAFAIINNTLKLSAQNAAETELILQQVSSEIQNQTDLLTDIIDKHSNTSSNEAKELLTIINNTYAVVIPKINESVSVIPLINQSIQEHRMESERHNIIPIGYHYVSSTIEDMQQMADELAESTNQNESVNKAIDVLSGSQSAPGPEALAGQIAGARDFGIEPVNQTNATDISRYGSIN